MSPNGRGTGQVYPIAQKTKTNYLENKEEQDRNLFVSLP